jgi:hypothetical protein
MRVTEVGLIFNGVGEGEGDGVGVAVGVGLGVAVGVGVGVGLGEGVGVGEGVGAGVAAGFGEVDDNAPVMVAVLVQETRNNNSVDKIKYFILIPHHVLRFNLLASSKNIPLKVGSS